MRKSLQTNQAGIDLTKLWILLRTTSLSDITLSGPYGGSIVRMSSSFNIFSLSAIGMEFSSNHFFNCSLFLSTSSSLKCFAQSSLNKLSGICGTLVDCTTFMFFTLKLITISIFKLSPSGFRRIKLKPNINYIIFGFFINVQLLGTTLNTILNLALRDAATYASFITFIGNNFWIDPTTVPFQFVLLA